MPRIYVLRALGAALVCFLALGTPKVASATPGALITPGMGTAAVTVYPNGTTQCSSGCTTTTYTQGTNGTPASVLVEMICLCSAAQTETSITCYDNNSAAASGTVVYVAGTLPAGQVITFTGPARLNQIGLTLVNGLTCQLQAAATGTGIFLWVQ